MRKTLIATIVCIPFYASQAQHICVPLTSDEAESRAALIKNLSGPAPYHKWEDEAPVDIWKQWELVENFSFGQNRGHIPMIADLQALHPYFRDKVLELIRLSRSKGIELAIVESYRTHTKQNEFRSMGRHYTRSRGGHSKHQYGLAVDVVPIIDSVAQWRNIKLWKKVGAIGEKLGLRWGGRWRHPFDPGHFEWSAGLGTAHLAQGIFPALPKTEDYPCVEEDLNELQQHWKAWEMEQTVVARAIRSRRLATKTMAAKATTVRPILSGGDE